MSEQSSHSNSSLPRSTRIIYAVFDFIEDCDKKKILLWTSAIMVLAVLSSGFIIIKKEAKGVRVRFGKVVDEDMKPGIHYRIPFIEKIHTRKVKRIIRRNISTRGDKKARFSILSGDMYLLEVDIVLQYKINHLRNFLFLTSDPEQVMILLARERLLNAIGQNFIDLIFTSNRDIIQERLFREVNGYLQDQRIGIELVSLNIVDVRPVDEMLAAFRDVNDAITEKMKTISNTHKKRERLILHSKGQVDAVIDNARAKAKERVIQARASADAFSALLAEYRKRPHQVAVTRYWQRMRTIFRDASLAAINLGKNANSIDINMIEDSTEFLPFDLSSKGTPSSLASSASTALDRPLFSTVHRDDSAIENEHRDTPLVDGSFHDSSTERHHFQTARMRSLIFDSPALFFHDIPKRQGPVATQQAKEKPMVEVLSGKSGGKDKGEDKKKGMGEKKKKGKAEK